MPTVRQDHFLIEKYFDSSDPEIHSPRNYLQSFYVAAIIDKCKKTKHYPLALFRNYISERIRSSVTRNMDDGTPLSSSDSAMKSKKKKNRRATFKIQI